LLLERPSSHLSREWKLTIPRAVEQPVTGKDLVILLEI
jgi:hypothetical protein